MASSSSPWTLIFLNLPSKTFLGIDLLSFDSSPNFHGIENVPYGLHFIYSGTNASLAIRHGRWLNIEASKTASVHVFKWNTNEETLVLLESRSSEALAATSAIPTLRKRGLVDYEALEDATSNAQAKQDANSPSRPGDWDALSSRISSRTLIRIISLDWTLTSTSSAPEDTERIPGLTELEASSKLRGDTSLDFAFVDLKQTWPEEAIGRDRTEKARDRTWYLGHLMDGLSPGDRQAGAKELLAELRFCFLMVLTLANYSCLEQWKRILSVIFTCRDGLSEIEGYFVEVLKALRLQMAHVDDVDGGLFELRDDSGSGWLKQLVSRFKGSVEEVTKEGSELRQELERFETFMKERYGWESGRNLLKRGMLELEDGEKVEMTMDGADEDDETGEYAPVVVET